MGNKKDMSLTIEKCLQNKLLNDIYLKYNQITKQNKSFPYLNYFGINYDNKGVYSVKFYFHLFNKLNEEQVALFLPTTEHYFQYEHLRNYSEIATPQVTGCAFEVKFYKHSSNPVLGFHYKLKPKRESFDLIGNPTNLPETLIDYSYSPAINYEYHKDKTLRKKYFYFFNPSPKQYFSKRFNIPKLTLSSFIEYAESENISKINAIFNKKSIEKLDFEFKTNKKILAICEKYQLYVKFLGFYESHPIKAYYFYPRNQVMPTSHNNELYQNVFELLLK